ncbi:MAG TPA: cation-translocating P-type ATPase [Chitinophagaceae bacterium]|nr:cation-translocating P-type ATPase [Chitinophagaceae bacterium]
MPGKVIHIENIKGLDEKDIPAIQKQYGKNIFGKERSGTFFRILWDIVREPMFILLAIACSVYFILGESSEGFLMAAAMIFVAAISLYQENKSAKALRALRQYTEPKVTVIRSGQEKIVDTEDLVPGDVIVLEEGNNIPADALIIQANDLSINESIITGESLPVEKNSSERHNNLFQGTTINSGKCIACVTAIGNQTALGKLGKAVAAYSPPKTLLQQQIGKFVQRLFFFGLTAFILIWLANYLKTGSLIQSLLFGLTLAMAAVPEEIPVAFSSFMALGAYKMSKLGIISRQPQTIENLGAVTVICLDKTGTITENKMEVKMVYDFARNELLDMEKVQQYKDGTVLYYAMLASEQDPFDAMEKAIHEAYRKYVDDGSAALKQVYEYPLEGKPPMMTHVYQQNNNKIIAAKGAAERILNVCKTDPGTESIINIYIKELASKGYRVLGVASAMHRDGELPLVQDAFNWKFEGLISLYDPPKKNIQKIFRQFYGAGINLKLVTGDYPETAVTIAEQTGMLQYQKYYTGNDVMQMKNEELKDAVRSVNLFARMFPEAKLKVIDALKANGEIVAMTGDGVNDGPALKSADIGIAMGKKGTEIARQASDLILTDDNIEKIPEAVLQGRKIFSNLKKAVRYIISIHIPIILTASLPLLFGWKYPNIFTPIHVIFLELIMGPTCSIFFEREPVEKDIMLLPPRDRTMGLFQNNELLVSILQGVIIAVGVLMLYYFYMKGNYTIEETRTIVFTTLVLSNIFLTFANRSFSENFTKTIFYKNNLAPWLLAISVFFLSLILFIPFFNQLFQLKRIATVDLWLCAGVAFVSVMWFELYKTFRRRRV